MSFYILECAEIFRSTFGGVIYRSSEIDKINSVAKKQRKIDKK